MATLIIAKIQYTGSFPRPKRAFRAWTTLIAQSRTATTLEEAQDLLRLDRLVPVLKIRVAGYKIVSLINKRPNLTSRLISQPSEPGWVLAETGKGDDYFDYLVNLSIIGRKCFEESELPQLIKTFVKHLLVVSFNQAEDKFELDEESRNLRMSLSK